MRVHIVGASGSGTTTLGRALAGRLGFTHLDTDDFYWLPGDPPFQHVRERGARQALLGAALSREPGWVLSGSLCGWGDAFSVPAPPRGLAGRAALPRRTIPGRRTGRGPPRAARNVPPDQTANGRLTVKLCQFFVPGKGKRVGVVDGDTVLDVTAPRAGVTSVTDLIAASGTAARLERDARALAKAARTRVAFAPLDRAPSPRAPHLLAPLDPPEIWGAGITYRRSREYYEAHTGEGGRTKGIYDFVYESERPELFFKASAARAAGPNAPIRVRADSTLTAVEAELALVLGKGGAIVGYTIGNDLSAWDIERANPLFLPQSKVFDGCFAFGPVLVTAGEIGDPHALDLACTIHRGGRVLYEGRVNTKEMKRRCDELVTWLCRDNTCPPGTVLSTGTGILVPDQYALADGDVVEITLERVGTLRNPVKRRG